MALTLKAEQRLAERGLIQFYTDHEAVWIAAAKRTYKYVKEGFPAGSEIRRDDVAHALALLVEVNETLVEKLAEEKLTQKYWVSYFTDLIIDRVWGQIQEDDGDGKAEEEAH